MGKDLKGKELGVGISQRKDGLYTARITDSYGKRVQKYFPKLQECRKWIADMQFQKEHGTINAGSDMTVDAWYDYWMKNIKGDTISRSTKNNIRGRYEKNIKEYIGKMLISEVKPLHCQNILNKMSGSYRVSSVGKTRAALHEMFESAVENEIILSNPVKKSVKCHSSMAEKPSRVLTVEEQKIFLETAKDYSLYLPFRFALQTGMRIGEIVGLKWQDIDFDNCILSVNRSTSWISKSEGWIDGKLKTESGKRKIPLTVEAIEVLNEQKKKNKTIKTVSFEYRDYVFLSSRGNPINKSNANYQILRICKKAGIERFSIHTLRHTFATRCIESGMKPKVLQTILGHANINMTMNLYVHATDDEKQSEMKKIERDLKVV